MKHESRGLPGVIAAVVVGGILIAALLSWFLTRDSLPSEVRIATASKNGEYYRIGREIALDMQSSLEIKQERVAALETNGSVENVGLLFTGQCEMAIVQGGIAESLRAEENVAAWFSAMEGQWTKREIAHQLSVVTPLYTEYVFVLALRDSDVSRLEDLEGRRVWIGPAQSGMRASAKMVLDYYGISTREIDTPVGFASLSDEPRDFEAAIVTAGLHNDGLKRLLGEDSPWRLIDIEGTESIDLQSAYYRTTTLPRDIFRFSGQSDRPSDYRTIATTSFLIARKDANAEMIQAALTAVHDRNLQMEVPDLIPRADAPEVTVGQFHPVSRRFFYPTDEIGRTAAVMESLAAGYELLFALGAGIYLTVQLIWRWQRKSRERESQRQKDHLDEYLNQTLRIERQQRECSEIPRLKKFLDEVTSIKLAALRELSDEEVKSDQTFAIFLTQCTHLMSTIQLKMLTLQSK